MSDSAKEHIRLKDRVDALCSEMIDRGILFNEAMYQFEKSFISEVLRRSGGNQLRAAQTLEIHRNTLAKRVACYKLKKK
jgi:DNA-binding protein Fis